MQLSRLHLLNFKNYEELRVEFSPAVNGITGQNGSGKTNLLDAIYYLSTTKSAFYASDQPTTRFGEAFFLAEGEFVDTAGEAARVQLSVQDGKGKVLKVNRQEYERMSGHIGRFPCVLVAPYDTDLIREGSEGRRKFFDGVLAQADAEYLDLLLRYNRLLQQRNSLLKQFAERHYTDLGMVEVYDTQLLPLMDQLAHKRASHLHTFLPVFLSHYQYISGGHERVSLRYESEVGGPGFAAQFREQLPRDLAAQYTTKGIHKDDYIFELDGRPIKKFGSQGQQKSFVIALKLAQFDFLAQQKGDKPLLLLDDIFDKLDDQRIQKLMQLMANGAFGQVFLTDARPERTQQIFQATGQPIHLLEVSGGHVVSEHYL
jgi:DNA replication and repair protein RecF